VNQLSAAEDVLVVELVVPDVVPVAFVAAVVPEVVESSINVAAVIDRGIWLLAVVDEVDVVLAEGAV